MIGRVFSPLALVSSHSINYALACNSVRLRYSVCCTASFVLSDDVLLDSLRSALNVTLPWVHTYRNIETNEWVDEPNRRGSTLHRPSMGAVDVPLATVNGGIYSHFLTAADFTWHGSPSASLRKIWPSDERTRSPDLLGEARANAYTITAVCLGHWL